MEMPEVMNDRLYNYDQAARRLETAKGTLQWWVHQGKVPHIRLGPRLVRFRESELETWLREREVTCTDVKGRNQG